MAYQIERYNSDLKLDSVVLLEGDPGMFNGFWTSRKICESHGFKPRNFATRGGAKNWIHKHGIKRAKVVKAP